MILAIGNQKGGVGKTTLAVQLANYFTEDKGQELLVVDFDFQGSFLNLWEDEQKVMDSEPKYEVIKKELPESKEVVSLAKGIENGLVLFDLPGKIDDDNLIPLYQAADFLLVPFSYDKICFESTMYFIQLVKYINENTQIIFIPNRIKSGVKYKTQEQIHNVFEQYGIITEKIPDRVCFQRLSVYGNTEEMKSLTNNAFETITSNIYE